jgi:ketosteroid isomerase-like protein
MGASILTLMASAKLDFVRSIYGGWQRADWSSTAWADPEIEFVIADGPSPFRATGVRAMASNWRNWLSAWEQFAMTAEEFRELDDERVLVLHRYSGRGRTSGLELDEMHARAAMVVHVRTGKVTRVLAYNDRDRALRDLGLAAEPPAADPAP